MLILAFGADVNEETNQDIERITPLILACQSSHLKSQYDVVRCLLENDAQPNQSVSHNSQYHSQHIPYRTPLVAYIKHAHDHRLDMRIVRLLIGYGARISFSRGRGMKSIELLSSPTKCVVSLVLDSVLRFLRRFQSNSYLIELLCDTAYVFQPSYIGECMELDEKIKDVIYRQAASPRTLKNIARERIRTRIFTSPMKVRIDRAVKQLQLPGFLERYLLFDDV